jgi:CBS domain-containing protein
VRVGRLPQGDVAVVDADAPIGDAWTTMVQRDLVRMPVTDEGRLIGMLRRTDLDGPLGEGLAAAETLAAGSVASI